MRAYDHFLLLVRSFLRNRSLSPVLTFHHLTPYAPMKGATNYEDQGDLKSPVNQVVAIIAPEGDLPKIIADLHSAGCASDEVGVLSGDKDARKLDAASGRQGWLTRLAKIGPGFGDLDAGNLKKYADALQHGQTVIAIVATAGSRRREIADLLKQHGATFINSYGMFSIEGLG
jgi:hypothetical protein